MRPSIKNDTQSYIYHLQGNALEEDRSDFIKAGADCVHVKPVSSSALAADIRRRLAAVASSCSS